MTNEELYQSLMDKGYEEQYINQLLKAREAGYDIYNTSLNLSTEQIREFRQFLQHNIEPVFNHGQLREIEIGWMKGLDISQFASPEFTKDEMCVLRKALENKKDISLIKEYGKDLKGMTEISKALTNGLIKEDIQKYSISQIEVYNWFKKRKSVDVKYLLDKDFDKSQIEIILATKKHCKDFHTYIDSTYETKHLLVLSDALKKHSYIELKPLFKSTYSIKQLELLVRMADEKVGNWQRFADPKINYFKMSILLEFLRRKAPEKELKIIENANIGSDRCFYVLSYLNNCNFKFDPILFDESINDESFKHLRSGYNLELFKHCVISDYPTRLIEITLRANQEGFDIASFVNSKTDFRTAYTLLECMRIARRKNIEIDGNFIINHIKNDRQKDLYLNCLNSKIDYTKIDYNLKLSQLNQIIYSEKANEIAPLIKHTFCNSQISAIRKAVETGLPTDNLLVEGLDPGTYNMILKLEMHNEMSEKKINIKELAELRLISSELGPLVGKLISLNLDDNIAAYKQISDLQIKNKNERNVEIVR